MRPSFPLPFRAPLGFPKTSQGHPKFPASAWGIAGNVHGFRDALLRWSSYRHPGIKTVFDDRSSQLCLQCPSPFRPIKHGLKMQTSHSWKIVPRNTAETNVHHLTLSGCTWCSSPSAVLADLFLAYMRSAPDCTTPRLPLPRDTSFSRPAPSTGMEHCTVEIFQHLGISAGSYLVC